MRVAYMPIVSGVAAATLYRFLILLGPIECPPIVRVAELGLTHLGIVLLDSEISRRMFCRYLILFFRSIHESSHPTN